MKDFNRNFNNSLTNKKIVLFLGAGFSNILGYPTMSEFVNKYLMSDLNKSQKEIINIINIVKNTFDLEEILAELEGIVNVKYSYNIEAYHNLQLKINASMEPYLYKGPPAESILKSKEVELVSSCKTIINKIKKKIFETYRVKKNLGYSEYDFIFNPILNSINFSNKKKSIPIFTTNYDNVIEEYFKLKYRNNIKIINGFNIESRIFDSKVLEKLEYTKEINIFIFHLHGSIYFYEDKELNCVKYSEISAYQQDKNYENRIIYPTKDKIPKDEPFFTYYDYLARYLDNASYVVFIGYSFRDFESLVRIKSSLIYNKDLKVIIIDNAANELKNNIFSNDKRVYPLNYYLISNLFKKEIKIKLKEIINLE